MDLYFNQPESMESTYIVHVHGFVRTEFTFGNRKYHCKHHKNGDTCSPVKVCKDISFKQDRDFEIHY